MGYFSWLTADTKQSIRVNKEKEVYLLQPNGQLPIKENYYNGFGDFGGIDAFDWLAENNLPEQYLEKAKKLIQENQNNTNYELRLLGISLDCGVFYLDEITGKKYCYNPFTAALFNFTPFLSYDMVLFNGKTVNQLIISKKLKSFPVSTMINGLKYPLKFSYNENATYELLSASETCPKQGFL